MAVLSVRRTEMQALIKPESFGTNSMGLKVLSVIIPEL